MPKKNPLKPPVSLPLALLSAALAGLTKAIDRKMNIPVLAGVLVQRNGETSLTASNLDLFLSYIVPDGFEGSDGLARKLILAKRAREESTSFVAPVVALREAARAADKKTTVTIHPDRVEYLINGQEVTLNYEPIDAGEFPPLPAPLECEPLPVMAHLRAKIFNAFRCVSEDETRHVIMGVYFDKKHKAVCGTDGRQLYRAFADEIAQIEDGFILRDAPALHTKAFQETDWNIYYRHGDRELRLRAGPWHLATKSIDGTYPNYLQVVDRVAKSNAVANFTPEAAVELLEALPKLPKWNGDASYPDKINIRFEKDGVVFTVQDAAYRAVAKVKMTGQPFTVALQRRYWLNAFRSGLFRVDAAGPLDPLIFHDARPKNADGGTLMVMPMRITT